MCELISKIQTKWFHQNSQENDTDYSECILSNYKINPDICFCLGFFKLNMRTPGVVDYNDDPKSII